MKKIISIFTFLLLSFFCNCSWGQIFVDETGNKFLTLGSTKNEVLEVLGTPCQVYPSLGWYYGDANISFDSQDRVKGYTDSAKLKILLLPPSSTNKSAPPSQNSSEITQLKTSTYLSSHIPLTSNYGEISNNTGRPKTVSVKGYTR